MHVPRTIRWRVNTAAPPATVFEALTTDAGRASFWADEAVESVADGVIRFRFGNGQLCESQVLERVAPHTFRLTYFGGSAVTFALRPDGRGGTDVCLEEEGVAPEAWADNFAGWVSVLLNLKARVDHDVDLRNGDRTRTWEHGYVDV